MEENRISIKIVNDEQQFFLLKEHWNQLLAHSKVNNIFLTWEWLYTWWENFKNDKELFIVLVEEEGNLVGIAPFYLTKVTFFGIRPLRHIEFIGSNDSCSDYLDFILLIGREKQLLYAIFDKVNELSGFSWDVYNFISIDQDSENLKFLKGYFNERNRINYIYNSIDAPYIRLTESFEEFVSTLSKDKRNKFRRFKNNLFREHNVTFYEVTAIEDLEYGFNTFIELHQKRWVAKGEKGSFSDSRRNYLEFHKSIVQTFFKNKWLKLKFLKISDKAVASQYNFIYKNKIYCFQQGLDPDWEDNRVGSVLQLMVIEEAINNKLTEFDFLRGEERYKYSWTKTSRRLVDLVVWRSKAAFYEISMERKLRRVAKFVIPKKLGNKIYETVFKRA